MQQDIRIMKYQMLEWDTVFFGINVARIEGAYISLQKLEHILSDLKQKNVKLVYWPSDLKLNQEVINNLGGQLVDIKTTFTVALKRLNLDNFIPTNIIVPYSLSMPITEIEDLAIQSGEYSRFAIDQHFPNQKFEALYKNWISQSLNKNIADEVLIIQDSDHIVGMITLGEKNGRGDIGLIAINQNHRGKKYGEKLVRAAQKWLIKNDFEIGQVITQGNNIPACNLYKKCGYSMEKVEYYYHFWL